MHTARLPSIQTPPKVSPRPLIALPRAATSYSTLPFDPVCVDGLINPHDCAFLEIQDCDSKLYKVLLAHLAKAAPDANSFRMMDQADDSDSDDEPSKEAKSQLGAGLGVFQLADLAGAPIVAIHQTSGEALANACGSTTKMHSIVLLKAGRSSATELR